MRTSRSAALKVALLLVSLILGVKALTAQQQSGAWKLESGKSKYNSGPAPKNVIVRVEDDEKGIKFIAEGINADGSSLHVQYDAKFDGKDYAVRGLTYADTVSLKRIDHNTFESTLKKDGQVMATVISKVSEDGKTRTSIFQRKDEKGNELKDFVVFGKMDIACGPKFCEKQCKGKCGNGTSCDCPKK